MEKEEKKKKKQKPHHSGILFCYVKFVNMFTFFKFNYLFIYLFMYTFMHSSITYYKNKIVK